MYDINKNTTLPPSGSLTFPLSGSLPFTFSSKSSLIAPVHSEWICYLFGSGSSLTLRPIKGKEPNWFWRKMQYLCFGNKWVKDKYL